MSRKITLSMNKFIKNYFPGEIFYPTPVVHTRAGGFMSNLRRIKNTPNPKTAFKDAAGTNTLLKNFADSTDITKNAVGKVKFDNFSAEMRSGNVSNSLIAANPNFATVATDSNAFVKQLKRETSAFPDPNIAKKNVTKTSMDAEFPQLKNAKTAEELEAAARANPKLKKMIDDLDAKASTAGGGTTKKLLFIGGAIIVGGSIYAALESYRSTMEGCFLYTKQTNGNINKCKIGQASCKNPSGSPVTKVCTSSELPDWYNKNTPCKDNTRTCAACNVKAAENSPDYVDPSVLGDNQTVECVQNATMLDALADIGSNMGWLTGGSSSTNISTLFKGIIYIFIGVVVLIISWNVFKALSKKTIQSKEQSDTLNLAKMISTNAKLAESNVQAAIRANVDSQNAIEERTKIAQNTLENAAQLSRQAAFSTSATAQNLINSVAQNAQNHISSTSLNAQANAQNNMLQASVNAQNNALMTQANLINASLLAQSNSLSSQVNNASNALGTQAQNASQAIAVQASTGAANIASQMHIKNMKELNDVALRLQSEQNMAQIALERSKNDFLETINNEKKKFATFTQELMNDVEKRRTKLEYDDAENLPLRKKDFDKMLVNQNINNINAKLDRLLAFVPSSNVPRLTHMGLPNI